MRAPYSTIIRLPWTTPPLNANQRLHWAHKAKLTKQIRNAVTLLARDVPFLDRIQVRLDWVVTDKRRRDEDNLFPTFKACIDGLVDADVVPDDTSDFVVREHPRIVRVQDGEKRIELHIVEVAPEPGCDCPVDHG